MVTDITKNKVLRYCDWDIMCLGHDTPLINFVKVSIELSPAPRQKLKGNGNTYQKGSSVRMFFVFLVIKGLL